MKFNFRSSLLILGIASQLACFVFDILSVVFFFSCEGFDCPVLGARLFGLGLLALLVLNLSIIAVASVKLLYSFDANNYPRTWDSEEMKDRLLPVRVCAHATRFIFFFVLVLEMVQLNSSKPSIVLAGLLAVLDVEWLIATVIHECDDACFEAKCIEQVRNVLSKVIDVTKVETACEQVLDRVFYPSESRCRFRVFTLVHFALNAAAFWLLLVVDFIEGKEDAVVIRSLEILTIAVLFFTAHDRLGLRCPIERCPVQAIAVLPKDNKKAAEKVQQTRATKMQAMQVESSYTMRSRLKSFKLTF